MAKKRKKEKAKEEEYEFRPPDFDEEEFLRKEIADTRTLLITVLYAVALGIGAGLLMYVNNDLMGVAFMLGVAGIASLRYFYPLLKVDVKSFQKKNWLGNSAVFFFTFLAIWVLVLNFPVSDHARPGVENVIVWIDDGTTVKGMEYKYNSTLGISIWVWLNSSDKSDPVISISEDATVNITARVTDNGNLRSVTIQLTIAGKQVTGPMLPEKGYRYGFAVDSGTLSTSGLTFTVTATDEAGNTVMWQPDRPAPVAP